MMATRSLTARVVLACDGARSACRRLLPSEPDDSTLLIDEGKSVWRGQAAGLDADGVSTTFKDDAGRTGLVMPAGVGAGLELDGHLRRRRWPLV